MFDQQPTLELLFEQLGLESSSEAIDQFIESHQLTSDIPLQSRILEQGPARFHYQSLEK